MEKNMLFSAVVIIFLGIAASTFAFAKTPPSQPLNKASRALWVWDKNFTVDELLTLKNKQDEFFAFCQNPHNGIAPPIKTIYLDAHRYPEEKAGKAALFLKRAHAAGMKVDYLGGDPNWAMIDHNFTLNLVKMVIEYNQDSNPDEKFDGIHFDIEPYFLPEWKKDKDKIIEQYLSLLQKIKKEIDASGEKLNFGVAIPVFFSEKDKKGFVLSDAVLKSVDYIAIMDYRDKGERIIAEGGPMVDAAGKMGKLALIGVETMDLVTAGEGTDYLTFFEEGVKYMEAELNKVENDFLNRKGYAGIAIHYYSTYKTLRLEYEKKVAKVPEFKIKKMKNWEEIPEIRINEGKNISYKAEGVKWDGERDLSAELKLAWDENNIYVWARIYDEKFIVTKAGLASELWAQDHAELWIAPDPQYISGLENKYQIGLSPGDFAAIKPFAHIWVPRDTSVETMQKIEITSKQLENGYSIEAQIPVSILENLRLETGTKLRMLFDFGDIDQVDAQQEILMTLSPPRAWGDPNTFAIVELVE